MIVYVLLIIKKFNKIKEELKQLKRINKSIKILKAKLFDKEKRIKI